MDFIKKWYYNINKLAKTYKNKEVSSYAKKYDTS